MKINAVFGAGFAKLQKSCRIRANADFRDGGAIIPFQRCNRDAIAPHRPPSAARLSVLRAQLTI